MVAKTVESLLPTFALLSITGVILLGSLLAISTFSRSKESKRDSDGLAPGCDRRIRRWSRWAVVVLPSSLFLALMGLAFMLEHAERTERHSRLRTEVIATRLASSPPRPPKPQPTDAAPATLAEVVSNDELASVASAPPKIKLDSEIVIGDNAADVKKDRPDWVDAHLGDNQKLIVSGPFTTKDSCQTDAQKQLTEWLWGRYRNQWPGSDSPLIDVSQVVKSQHEEIRDTSVGEVHLLYTLAEVTPEVEAQIAKSLADAAAQVAQKRGVRAVTFGGAGVLSLVALAHIVLRSGGRKNP